MRGKLTLIWRSRPLRRTWLKSNWSSLRFKGEGVAWAWRSSALAQWKIRKETCYLPVVSSAQIGTEILPRILIWSTPTQRWLENLYFPIFLTAKAFEKARDNDDVPDLKIWHGWLMRKSVTKITYHVVHNSPSSFAAAAAVDVAVSSGSWVAGGVGSREAPCSCCSGDAQVHSLEGCSLPRSLPLSCIGDASIENSCIDLRGEIRKVL